jgi:uncharacterized repeat protein (TIGR01451 family)
LEMLFAEGVDFATKRDPSGARRMRRRAPINSIPYWQATMAGKIRIAAKLFLGTTLLAGGGGGAYYYTTGAWPLSATLMNRDERATNSELDSVASAWAEPETPSKLTTADSSAVARSANVTLAHAEVPAPTAPVGNRYEHISAPATGETAPDDHAEKLDKLEPQPTPAGDAQVVSTDAAMGDKDAAKSIANVDGSTGDVKSPAAPEVPIARGQAPPDDLNVVESRGGAAEAASAFGDVVADNSLRPIKAVKQQPGVANDTNRARQAFDAKSPTTPGDRYGGAAPPAQAIAGAPGQSTTVNPFATKTPTNASAGAKRGTVEPLPNTQDDIGGRLTELQQGGEGLRPLNTNRTARATVSDSASGSLPPAPLNTAPDTPFGATVPVASAPMSANGGASPSGVEGTGRPGEKTLEGPQQPSLVIQKFAPAEIQVGKPAKFAIQVRNVGGQAADGVTIHDEVPKGTQLVSTSPNGKSDGSHLSWDIGKLSAGEDRTVEMQLMPTAEGEIGSVATVSYTAQASVKAHCTMPQLAIRMTAPGEVMIGNQQHVKIEIRNPGSGDATGVMLFENVPKNVKHAAGPTLEFEIGTLRAGETRELDLVLTAEKAGKVLNSLTARADGNLQVQQQVEFEVIAPALTVDVNGPERRYLERPATYEVSVENPGTAAAHDVQIVTKLPKGMRFVRANNMGEYDASTHAVYWTLSELPKGERGTVEVVAMPMETGPQTLEVEGHAQQGLTDQKKREIIVEGLAAIKFEVKDLEDPIEVGGETGYEIRVVNQGTKAADNVQVAIELPPGMKLVSAEGETPHKAQQGRVVFEPLQQLAPKADTVYRVRVQGMQAGDQRVMVEVNTDDLGQPIRREESTRVFGDQ